MSLKSPLILVSAQDSNTAQIVISELIGNEVSSADNTSLKSRVWHLKNKYYRVDVQLYPIGDGELLATDLFELVEAHIIYIANTETEIVSRAERRLSQKSKADVCLLLFDGAHVPEALQAWACSHYYECVPLRETRADAADSDSEADGPFEETYGIEQARASLHAHTWPGLERLDLPATVIPPLDEMVLSSDEDWRGAASEDEDGEEGDVERAEVFAAALGALAEARTGARTAAGDDERRQRAERALHAFCHAMGAPLDLL